MAEQRSSTHGKEPGWKERKGGVRRRDMKDRVRGRKRVIQRREYKGVVGRKGEGSEIREEIEKDRKERRRERLGLRRVRKGRRIGAGFQYPLLSMLTTSQQHHRAGD